MKTQSYLDWRALCPPTDRIWALMLVRRIRGNTIRMALCCIVYDCCAQWYAHTWAVLIFLTGSIARSAKRRLFNLLRGRFWGLGDTLHLSGWNLARRRGPKVPSSVPIFTPIGATIKV